MQPTPEPQSYIDAQVEAMADPKSERDTVLITPGSPLPSVWPKGAKVYFTRRGVVITTNPKKAQLINSGTEEEVGRAIFGYGRVQDGTEQSAAVAMNANGTPVAEIALGNDPTPGLLAAQRQMPTGGLLAVLPKSDLIQNRLKGLLDA